MKLFVYGGLLKGMTLSPFIEGSTYLGPAYIRAEIYFLGQFPGIINGNNKVFGELYELDEHDLPALDKIEDYHPGNHEKSSYIRKNIEVNSLPEGSKITAQAYFYNRPIEKKHIYIKQGDYRQFILSVEKEKYWVINHIFGDKTNGFFKDSIQNIKVENGFLQLIDIQNSNGILIPKKEKITVLELNKEQLNRVKTEINKKYEQVSVPFFNEKGTTDIAIAWFKS